MSHGPDRSVRLAMAQDAPDVASCQARGWAVRYQVELGPSAVLDPEVIEPVWLRAITTPADARQRVLVALDGPIVVGFVLTCPATDPDTEPHRDGEVV